LPPMRRSADLDEVKAFAAQLADNINQ